MFTAFFKSRIRSYVQQYFAVHPEVKLVAVSGSIGKESAKRAIATVVSRNFRVRMRDNLAKTPFEVDLALLGIEMPSRWRVGDMWRALRVAKSQLKHPPTVDVIVQDLIADRPGAIAHYSKYIRPDIAVVTSVTPTIMENFGTLDAVAQEQLAVPSIAEYAVINRDDVPSQFATLETNANFNTYGSAGSAEFRVDPDDVGRIADTHAQLVVPDLPVVDLKIQTVGEHSARPLAAAAACGLKLGMTIGDVVAGLENVLPLPGRMNPLRGLEHTTVVDDSWGMDPDSAVAGLQTLYQFEESSRIAVFGSMYHLMGETQAVHMQLGEVCNPDLLSWVVVTGQPAAEYLAPVARRHGCQVKICRDAIEVAEFVRSVSEERATILIKGSPEDMLEEAVKELVALNEHHKLVRQSPEWIQYKQGQFSRFAA